MIPFSKMIQSSVGKKYLMALTGLTMILFLIEHLIGNLLLYSKDSTHYNEYAHFALSFGPVLNVIELVLVAFLLIHVLSGISVALGKLRARPVGYQKTGNAGGASRKTFSSKTMIYTGILTFLFVVVHLVTFKYGGAKKVMVDGVEMIDLYGLVWKTFSNPIWVAVYVGYLIFLGFHLRHGFWSAFQSLGASHPRYSPIIASVGVAVALVLAVGFLAIPIWIFIGA